MSAAITSVFNDGVFAEQFERYRHDPASVDESWRQYFRMAEALLGAPAAAPAPAGPASVALLRKVAAAASLQQAIRNYGHYAVQLDPLGTPPPGADELDLAFHGLTEDDLAAIPAAALGDDRFATAAEVIRRKREVYSGRIGYEVWHLEADDEREWFRQAFRDGVLTRPLTADESRQLLRRLHQVDGLERFLGRTYQGYKRFSVEGTDALIPMLDEVIRCAGAEGAREVVIGMAHRGRLNVLTNVMGKPFEALFAEFEGRHDHADENATGDVKYHMGYLGERTVDGRPVRLRLVPNPSHLEVVNPVIQGVARALQRDASVAGGRDEAAVVPVAIHGDAAFPGQGVVAETLNISRLAGFRTGGTIHLIVNNQVGFTTDPIDSRSTHYASDLAKGFEIPVLHVNADDPEVCLAAVRLACAYRAAFRKDVVIDLVGYRRHGHNEGDEPLYTQPVRYTQIRQHPTAPQVWAARLVAAGTLTADEAAQVEREVMQHYADLHARFKQALGVPEGHAPWPEAAPGSAEATAVPRAPLPQRRGRVGRSHRRAYCYLVVPDTIDADAEERLRVLEHHTDLGAGYRIALKDLELRGAGNLLGSEQSGHAHAVGFDLYMRWLEETVTALRGQGKVEAPQPPDVVFDVPAHLPEAFVPDDEAKLDLYRRLARASGPGDIDDLRNEVRERFGPLPPPAEALFDMGRLRVIGATLGVQHVLVRGDEARLTFRQGTAPRMAGLTRALDDVQLAAEVRRTVPLSLRLVRLGGEPLIPTLVRALRQVAV